MIASVSAIFIISGVIIIYLSETYSKAAQRKKALETLGGILFIGGLALLGFGLRAVVAIGHI
jgi:hypothetical protein